MLVRLRFSREYPLDFSEKEKECLKGLIRRIINSKIREYEFDSRRMNLFKFYTLLVDFGYREVKLDVEKKPRLYYMNLYKDVIFEDEIVIEF